MKRNKYLIVVLFASLLIQSCANYKPAIYDTTTSQYKNYKQNYAINIIDGYALLSEQETAQLELAHFDAFSADPAIFYDDKSSSTLGLFTIGNIGYIEPDKKLVVLGSLTGAMRQAGKKNVNIKSVTADLGDDDVTVNMHVLDEEVGSDVTMKIVLYPTSKKSNKHAALMFILALQEESDAEQAKSDFLKMYDSLELTTFDNNERLLQE